MRLGRKISGGKYHSHRKKKLHERKGQEVKVTLGEPRKKTTRVRGGNQKIRVLRTNIVNLSTPGSTKVKKSEIKNVVETPQNVFFARQNVLFKGSIIETSDGKAKITNRPTQEGFVNAVLISE